MEFQVGFCMPGIWDRAVDKNKNSERTFYRMEGIFKTSMSGFKKSDVVEFIDKQENEFKQIEKNLQDRIEELNGELKDERAEKEHLTLKISRFEEQLEAEKNTSSDAAQMMKSFEDEVIALKSELNRSEALAEELKREFVIHKQNCEAKNIELAKKDAELEKLKNTISTISTTQQRISRVMVEAQNTADNIVGNAKKEASVIIREAEKKLNLLLKQTDEFKKDVDILHRKADDFTGGVECISVELSDYAYNLDGGVRHAEGCVSKAEACVAAAAAQAPAEDASAHKAEKKPGTGSLFDFSLQNKMFNWDKI
jgi:chromosome segregation ATPase